MGQGMPSEDTLIEFADNIWIADGRLAIFEFATFVGGYKTAGFRT